MYAVAKRTLILFGAPFKSLSKEKFSENENPKKVNELNELIRVNTKYFQQVFNIVWENTVPIFEASAEAFKQGLTNASSKLIKGDKKDKKGEAENKEVETLYHKFHSQLYDVLVKHNKFLDFLHIYTAVITSEKNESHQDHVINLCLKLPSFLEAYSKYAVVDERNNDFDETHNVVKTTLETDLIRFFTYTLSKTAATWIAPSFEEVNEDLEELIQSKLFSGGIKPQHSHILTNWVKKVDGPLKDFLGELK